MVRANAPVNGIYFGSHGISAAVAFLPDLGDKTKSTPLSVILSAAKNLSGEILRSPWRPQDDTAPAERS